MTLIRQTEPDGKSNSNKVKKNPYCIPGRALFLMIELFLRHVCLDETNKRCSSSYFQQARRNSPSQMFLKIGLLKNLQFSQENNFVGVSFNRVAGLQACIFIRTILHHMCFPVKII